MPNQQSKQEAAEKKLLAKKLKEAEKEARRKAITDRERFHGLQIKPTVSYLDESERKEPGEDNWVGLGFDLHPKVTIVSTFILVAFILTTIMFRDQAGAIFNNVLSKMTSYFGWFFILSVNAYILAALFFAFSKFGKIRIGGKDAKPEFTTPAWFAMLLSAGMGIGLMFWSVGEPMYHFSSPSPMFTGVEAGTPEAAQAAMGITYFHWGIHPWATYSIVALGLAFFAYNRGLPLTIRSIFYPLLGEKIYGFWGNLIDILSVLATLMGLATSLGLGVKQVNSGLHFLFGIPISITVQIVLIAVITAFATLSVMSGLDGGVKRLSKWNMVMAGVFMLFLLIAGPTVYILGGFTQNLGYYLTKLPEISLWAETFRDSNWQGSWTVFYWAWWISWSPFVGMFIARISKGRTVREFVLTVMIIPTLLSFLWMSVFGGSALNIQTSGALDLVSAVKADVSTAMFEMLKFYPMTELLSFIGIVLVTVFFVTSSDSGSLVVDHLTSGGKLDSPIPQRVFWAIMEGAVAAVLLLGGGLTSLQTASVTTGLPFALVLLLIIYSLYMGFSEEIYIEEKVQKRLQTVKDEHMVQTAIDKAIDS
jgi:choline/glycine/proline betaine transport protein